MSRNKGKRGEREVSSLLSEAGWKARRAQQFCGSPDGELVMYWSNQNSGPTTSRSSTASKPKFTIGCNNLPTIQKLVRRLSSVIEEIKRNGTSR